MLCLSVLSCYVLLLKQIIYNFKDNTKHRIFLRDLDFILERNIKI